MISVFTMETTVSTGKMLIAAEKQTGALATLPHSLNHARPFLQRTPKIIQKRFLSRLCQHLDMIRTGNYFLLDVWDGVPKRLQ